MALDATQYKTLITNGLGRHALVTANLDLVWDLHAERTPLHLQYLYAKRDLVRLLLEAVWGHVNFSEDGQQVSDSDKTDHLQAMLKALNEEIAGYAGGGGVSGDPTTVAPEAAPAGWPDANHYPGYSGTPYYGGLGRIR